MELITHRCKRCGGELSLAGEQYACRYCGSHYDVAAAEQHTASMQEMFDAQKREHIHNLRRILYDAVTAEYISRDDVVRACDELKTYLPDDPAANFFKVAAGENIRELNRAIRRMDVKENYDEVGLAVSFLVKSMTADGDYLLALNDLVERAYKQTDLASFSKYATMISEMAERVNAGIYETTIPRDVFIAYSGKDMAYVQELTEALEEQGMTCFVAARNLRHGVGSVENYDRALKEAMDNCRVFVFVSGLNSRNMSCDALRVELAYIKKCDLAKAPAQYQSHYDQMPHEYKKPRVEYRIEESHGANAADKITDQFFSGYERVYTAAAVVERVAEILCEIPTVTENVQEVPPTYAAAPSPASAAPATNVSAFLERVFMFLEDGNWQEANAYCERVLDMDPKNAEAYLGKLMAHLKIKRRTDLKNARELFTENAHYQKILRFGGENLKQELAQALELIRKRMEAAEQEKIYREALGLMKNKTEADCRKAARLFASIMGYKDAEKMSEECGRLAEEAHREIVMGEAKALMNKGTRIALLSAIEKLETLGDWKNATGLIQTCQNKIRHIDEDAERARAAEAQAAEDQRKKKKAKKNAILVGIVVVILVIIGIVIVNTVILPLNQYNKAVELMNKGNYQDAYDIFIELGHYKDSREHIDTLVSEHAQEFLQVGDILVFGNYEQDSKTSNGKEGLEWIILKKEGARALVITKDIIDCQVYHNEYTGVTWENSTLRHWMNDSFIKSAFSAQEKAKIINASSLVGSVFALSVEEAEQYADTLNADVTAYAKEQGVYAGGAEWWLRTPGKSDYFAATVSRGGNIKEAGMNVNFNQCGVRPAMWVDLWSEAEAVESDDQTNLADTDVGEDAETVPDLSAVSVGDTIKFGIYEQDNNTDNGQEEIEWIVLAKENGRALVISKYVLNCQPHHTTEEGITWEACTLRTWLNDTFLNSAFTVAELSKIITSTISNPDNSSHGTEGGNTTTDKLFLLSIDEAKQYFGSDTARATSATAYAKAQGVDVKSDNGNSWWWLRSPGFYTYSAAYIDSGGGLHDGGYYVNYVNGGVRPAMWVDLWSEAETVGSDDQTNMADTDVGEEAETVPDLSAVSVGDTIKFGTYEQDNNTSNGKEAIEWIVLAQDGDRVLLISKYALDCQPYNTSYSQVTWESCSLRSWLNSTFMEAAFAAEEQDQIQETTLDKIFLLSLDEVGTYFNSNEARQTSATPYAHAQGEQQNGSNGNAWWWLRSAGRTDFKAATVNYYGEISTIGASVEVRSMCVRPAMWVSLAA